MPQKIIGLDIGSYSIKAVHLRRTFRGFELVGFREQVISREGETAPSEAVAQGIAQLYGEGHLSGDVVISSIPGHQVSARIVKLPFSDRKKLEQVIPFEVEGYTPFNIEDMVVSYHIVNVEEGEAQILALLAKKDVVRDHLEILGRVDISPKIVDLDVLALYTISSIMPQTGEDPFSIADIGASKTSLCIIDGGHVSMIRTLPIGGDAITRAIQGEFDLPYEEAEKGKILHGIILEEGEEPQEERRFSHCITSSLSPLIREMKQTFHSYEADHHKGVHRVFLCGGTSALGNLIPYLSRELGVEAEPLDVLDAPFSRLPSGAVPAGLIPHGLGLGLRGVGNGRVSQVNFRRNEFALRSEIREIKGRLLVGGIIMLAILLLVFFDLYLKMDMKQRTYEDLRAEVRKVFTATLPEVKNIVNEVQQMRSEIQGLKKGSFLFSESGEEGMSMLDLMREITVQIPGDVTVDVKDLAIDRGRVAITGETDSFESVDKIRAGLQKFTGFKRVSLTHAKVGGKGDKVEFKFSISMGEGRPR
jgi:type IV pilus assembly protein PilM